MLTDPAWDGWNKYSIDSIDDLRSLLRSVRALESLAQEGDSVSATILLDIRKAMRYEAFESVRVLTEEQFRVIQLYLIEGRTTRDVENVIKKDRRMIFYYIKSGLRRMLCYLHNEEFGSWYWQPWQVDFVARNQHLPREELAARVGKNENAVRHVLQRLQGTTINRGASRRDLGSGSEAATRLAAGSVPMSYARTARATG
jgi:hypothetical protein